MEKSPAAPVAPQAAGCRTVSVVIPAYNASRYLAATLESVMQQDVPASEVILVDDGSTDDTVDIARSFGVTVISSRNGGASAARNVGTMAASGEYIAYMDADDVWPPEKLECQLAALRAYPRAAFSFTDFRVFNDEGVQKRTGLLHHPAFRQVLRTAQPATDRSHIVIVADGQAPVLPECYIQPSSVLVRRADVLAVGGFDESVPLGEDYEFFLRLFKLIPAVAVMRSLLFYRQHPAQASARYTDVRAATLDIARRVALSPHRYPTADVKYMPTIAYRRYYRLGIEQARREHFDDAVDSLERSLTARPTFRARVALLAARLCRSVVGRTGFRLVRHLWKRRPGQHSA
jgi:glycosyltransferase involved in cell wall biosynthesis